MSPQGQGEFFAVDRMVWTEACELGLNPAAAFLVLARFSGGDNVTTCASVHAIERYTNISRWRARAAIESLIDGELIKRTRGGSSPQYKLNHDLRGERIWLPNELVTGAASELPPVERVRQTQDPMTLRLLVELYHEQNLREYGGVDRRLIRGSYKRHRVGERGQYVVYGFETGRTYVSTAAHVIKCHFNAKPQEGENHAADFFRRFSQLQYLGLVEVIPHLFESEAEEAEIIHPYGIGCSDDLANRLGRAAENAARALLTEQQCAIVDQRGWWLAPVPRHVSQVAMVAVARLRYRPRTRLTGAWWADYQEKVRGFLARYEAISATAVAA